MRTGLQIKGNRREMFVNPSLPKSDLFVQNCAYVRPGTLTCKKLSITYPDLEKSKPTTEWKKSEIKTGTNSIRECKTCSAMRRASDNFL